MWQSIRCLFLRICSGLEQFILFVFQMKECKVKMNCFQLYNKRILFYDRSEVLVPVGQVSLYVESKELNVWMDGWMDG